MSSLAIIGGGFSGATLALQVLQSAPNTRISLIDRSGRFGPGLAYSSAHAKHLLNVRAQRASAYPNKPDDFVDWLRFFTRADAPAQSFAPRAVYGAYLETLLRRAAREAPPGALTFMRDQAIACTPDKTGVSITLSSGEHIRADHAVLALGNPPPHIPAPFDTPEHPVTLIDPWDASALARVQESEDVLVLGTGLTMIDTVLALASGPRSGRIIALSRRGLAPRPHLPERASTPPIPLDLPLELSKALRAFRAAIHSAEARGASWQTLMDQARPHTTSFWQRLSPAAQQRFLRHLRPYWDAHRHRTPTHVHAWMEAMQAAGILRILAGRVESADRRGRSTRVAIATRHGGSETLNVGHIVNCTAPCMDLTLSNDTLVRRLLDDGIARAHPARLGLDVREDGRVVGADGAPHRRLFALGPLTLGAFWEATAIPEIRDRAASLVALLVKANPRRPALATPSRALRVAEEYEGGETCQP